MVLVSVVPHTWRSNRKPVNIVNSVLTPDVHPALTDDTKVAETRYAGEPHGDPHDIGETKDSDLADKFQL
jgi:hypothetical protein